MPKKLAPIKTRVVTLRFMHEDISLQCKIPSVSYVVLGDTGIWLEQEKDNNIIVNAHNNMKLKLIIKQLVDQIPRFQGL